MAKKTSLVLLTAILLSLAGVCRVQEETSSPEAELRAASIVVRGAVLSVRNGDGSVLEIFSLTGAKVTAIRIDGDEKTIDLTLKKGCYILKLGKIVRKISIR